VALLLLLPATIAPYHAGILLIPGAILYLSLKMNAPVENLLATGIFIWAFWDLMSLFSGGKELYYSNLALVGLLLASSLLLEKMKRGNLTTACMLCSLAVVFLVSSTIAFDGETLTTVFWTALGAVLITAGLSVEKRYLRLLGMMVVVLTTGKIFTYDLREIPFWAMAISLFIAGAALLGISYLYHSYREKQDSKKANTAQPSTNR